MGLGDIIDDDDGSSDDDNSSDDTEEKEQDSSGGTLFGTTDKHDSSEDNTNSSGGTLFGTDDEEDSSEEDEESSEDELFEAVKNFNPESGEVPICPECKSEGVLATDPTTGRDLHYYRCTTDWEECKVLQYVYSSRKERFVHTEEDGLQKKMIQKGEEKKRELGLEGSDPNKSTGDKWDDFLDNIN